MNWNDYLNDSITNTPTSNIYQYLNLDVENVAHKLWNMSAAKDKCCDDGSEKSPIYDEEIIEFFKRRLFERDYSVGDVYHILCRYFPDRSSKGGRIRYRSTYAKLRELYSELRQKLDVDVADELIKLFYNKEDDTMNPINNNFFNGLFGRIEPGMCRLSMSGKIAIKTSNGYKAYDVKSGRLTNCDSFVFDIGQDFFFLIPTNHVVRGDIIIAGGKPRCVLEVNKNELKTFCYEDSTISTIVPERHMFMGEQFFYGKIVSMFGDMSVGKGSMKKMMKFMMMSEMMKGGSAGGNGMAGMLPMMFMMNSGESFFDGMFDFGEDDTDETDLEQEA